MENVSPTSGLDLASLDAAKAQLVEMTSNLIPKLTWLIRKASSEAVVHRYVAKTSEDLERERQERDFVKARGGHIVQEPHARDTEKLEKVAGQGLGVTWSKQIVSVIVELHEALGDLSETFMSGRTLAVLRRASKARARAVAEGEVPPPAVVAGPQTKEEARQRALQATGLVWQVCDSVLKGKLPEDNRAAVTRSWKARTDVLKDALREFKEVLLDDGPAENGDDEDEDDPLAGLQAMTLTAEEKKRAASFEPLVRAGCKLHATAGEVCLRGQPGRIDYDELEEAGMALSSAVDELVSSLLYAGELSDNENASADGSDETVESEVQEAIESFSQAIKRLGAAALLPTTQASIQPILVQIDGLSRAVQGQ